MSKLLTKENWSELKPKLKEDHPILTDKDLSYEEGKEEKILATLQEKLGKTKNEVTRMIRNYMD